MGYQFNVFTKKLDKVGVGGVDAHADTHITGGSDPIADAVPDVSSGLMSGADKSKLDSIPTLSVTHAELVTMVTGNLLVVGQQYLMTDFRTRHSIPNTADYNTGSIEPLILTAVTTSTFCESVCSQIYPTDEVVYEFVDTSVIGGGDRGRITRRKDTLKNGEMFEDWKVTQYRRWLTIASLIGTPVFYGTGVDGILVTGNFTDIIYNDFSVSITNGGTTFSYSFVQSGVFGTAIPISTTPVSVGLGVSVAFGATPGHIDGDFWIVPITGNIFSNLFDNALVYRDFPVCDINNSDNFSICGSSNGYSNNIITGQLSRAYIGDNCTDNTCLGQLRKVKFESSFSQNIFYNGISNSNGSNNFSNNNFLSLVDNIDKINCIDNFSANTFYAGVDGLTTINNFQGNTFNKTTTNLKTEDNCRNNIFEENSNLTVGDNFYGNFNINVITSSYGSDIIYLDFSAPDLLPIEGATSLGTVARSLATRGVSIGNNCRVFWGRGFAGGYSGVSNAPRSVVISPNNTEIKQQRASCVGTLFTYTTDETILLNDWTTYGNDSGFYPDLPVGSNADQAFYLPAGITIPTGAFRNGDKLVGSDGGPDYVITGTTTLAGGEQAWTVDYAPVDGETILGIKHQNCLEIYKQTNPNNGFDANDPTQLRFHIAVDWNSGYGKIDTAKYLKHTYLRTDAPTLTLDDTHEIVESWDSVATFTLPTAVGRLGKKYNIINGDTNIITIDTTDSQTISGDLTLVLTNQWDSVVVYSNGISWVRGS